MPNLPNLPIQEVLSDLKKALVSGPAVLAAPPGSGKTTIVPLALLDEPWLRNKKILILEPRRLATRAAAARMSSLLGEKVGQTVGYQIRFDRQISKGTRIEVVTEGILTRRIQNDPDLTGVGLIIFDEFHERSIHADLALALCLDICQLKDDLRLLVMSATLDTGAIAELLGNAPVITGQGQSHEVRIAYLDRQPREREKISDTVAKGVKLVLSEQQGDVLVFLPGAGEIRDTHRQLAADLALRDVMVLPLFGNLSQQEQDRAILPDPGGGRRVILATSIAETSLTIEGIGCVVDSGWSRRPRFEPNSGLSKLTTVRVSRAAARQRAGRAGRLGPGYCLRLWTKNEHHGLLPFHPPEIVSIDLTELAMELAMWGVSDPHELRWLDPPRSGPYEQARELLFSLGALDESGRITAMGRQLASLPIHPRLGHMLLMARELGQAALACDLAAILSEKDILHGRRTTADLQARVWLLELWRAKGAAAVVREGGDPATCGRVERAAGQWRRLVKAPDSQLDYEEIGNLLVYAYPDRIARRRPGKREQYLLASGRAANLPPADPLAASEYLVAPQVDGGHGEGRIFLAEPLELADVQKHHQELLTTTREVRWDERQTKVVAARTVRLGQIVIDERPWAEADPHQINQAMLEGIRQMGIECLPWDREARRLQGRVAFVRHRQPDMGWPDLSDEQLLADASPLEPYLIGINKRDQLKILNLLETFKAILGWDKLRILEQYAPDRITVPSGSKIRLEYRAGEPPLLAARIQEMFGLAVTPTVANGEVPVLLHLLSPAMRPIQVTTDLAGFWQRGYPEVKKELMGRYPKHFWPDNPLEAEATSRTKKRMKTND